jgi:hypothetical protein
MIMKSPLPVSKAFGCLILIGMSFLISPASATIFFEDGANRTVADVYDLMSTQKPTDDDRLVVFFYDPAFRLMSIFQHILRNIQARI